MDCFDSNLDGNDAEPLGNQAVRGHLAAGEEFGLDNGFASVDLLSRAAAVDVFLAAHRPGRNPILGPLFEVDVVLGNERTGGNVGLGNTNRRSVGGGRRFAALT